MYHPHLINPFQSHQHQQQPPPPPQQQQQRPPPPHQQHLNSTSTHRQHPNHLHLSSTAYHQPSYLNQPQHPSHYLQSQSQSHHLSASSNSISINPSSSHSSHFHPSNLNHTFNPFHQSNFIPNHLPTHHFKSNYLSQPPQPQHPSHLLRSSTSPVPSNQSHHQYLLDRPTSVASPAPAPAPSPSSQSTIFNPSLTRVAPPPFNKSYPTHHISHHAHHPSRLTPNPSTPNAFNHFNQQSASRPTIPNHLSSPSTPLTILSNGSRKKIKVRLPLEFTPDHALAPDESRIRSRWLRNPLSLKLNLSPKPDPQLDFQTKSEWPERLGNRLPDSIDVYLPGKEVWDDYRAEILDEKLIEIGYGSSNQDENLTHLDLRLRLEAYLTDHPDSTLPIPNIPGIYPFASPPSPISPVVKPLMSFTAPLVTPRGHSSTMSIALPGTPTHQFLSRPPYPSLLASPTALAHSPLRPSTQTDSDHSESLSPGLKPTAPEFKPVGALHPNAPEFKPTWAPAPPTTPVSIRPRSSISPHRMALSPTLMIVGEEEEEEEEELPIEDHAHEEEIVTDSEPEHSSSHQHLDEQDVLTDSDMDLEDEKDESHLDERSSVAKHYFSGSGSQDDGILIHHDHPIRNQISSSAPQLLRQISFDPSFDFDSDSPVVLSFKEQSVQPISSIISPRETSSVEEEDDIPLAELKTKRLHTTQAHHHLHHRTHSSSVPAALIGYENSADDDFERQSDYTNPSDEEEAIRHRSRQPSSNSLPNHRTDRSQTFGMSSRSFGSSTMAAAMAAGEGHPHNWINGTEDEEDIISNPSVDREGMFEDPQGLMNDAKPFGLNELPSSLMNLTNRALFAGEGHPDLPISTVSSSAPFKSTPTSRYLLSAEISPERSNLGVAVGRATGSAIVVNCFAPPNPATSAQLGGLNAYAAEFRPNFTFSSPIPNLSLGVSLKKDEDSFEHEVRIAPSPGRGVKRQKTEQEVWLSEGENAESVGHQAIPSNSFSSSSLYNFLQSTNIKPALDTEQHELPIQPPQELSFERPGKDNMRTFKFPVKTPDVSVEYSVADTNTPTGKPVKRLDLLPRSHQSVSLPPPFSLPALPTLLQNGASPVSHSPPLPPIANPNSPLKHEQPNPRETHALRPQSSFEDDSSPEHSRSSSPSPSRPNPGHKPSFELIPTQPRSDDGGVSAYNSMISLTQLQQQKKEWSRIGIESETEPSPSLPPRIGSASKKRGGIPTFADDELSSDIRLSPPALLVPLLRTTDQADNHTLTPDHARMNLVPRSPSFQSPRSPLMDNLSLENIDDLATPVSIRNSGLVYSTDPSSPQSRINSYVPRSNQTRELRPQRQPILHSEEDVPSPLLGNEDDAEVREETSSQTSGSPLASKPSPSPSRQLSATGRRQSHTRHSTDDRALDRMLTKTLKELRHDLSGLHSLKVDFDMWKRDALLDEMDARLDIVLKTWVTERMSCGTPTQIDYMIFRHLVDESNQRTEVRVLEAVEEMKATFNYQASASQQQPEILENMMKSVKQQLMAEVDKADRSGTSEILAVSTDNGLMNKIERLNHSIERLVETSGSTYNIEEMTLRLSEAVKPQIYQLIDLTSDKSETAGLIAKELKPSFEKLCTDLRANLVPLPRDDELSEVGRDQLVDQIVDRIQSTVTFHSKQATSSLWSEAKTDIVQAVDSRATELVEQLSSMLSHKLASTETNSRELLLKKIEDCIKPHHEDSSGATEESLELLQQLDLKSLNFYQDLSQQIAQSSNDLMGELKVELERSFGQLRSSEVQQSKATQAELETALLKARADHGRVRSERAVEKDRHSEERVKWEAEMEEMKRSMKELGEELNQARDRAAEVERARKSVEEQKLWSDRALEALSKKHSQVEARCENLECKELEWQGIKFQHNETVGEMKIQIRMLESDLKSSNRRAELSTNAYEKAQSERHDDLKRFQQKEDELRKELRTLEKESKAMVRQAEMELREALEVKASLEGEVRTLEQRLNKLDEQIAGLRDMSAAKQQSLATANQRLFESERRGKELDSLRAEIAKLQIELRNANEHTERLDVEKAELDNQVSEMRAESEQVKAEVEKMYESVSKELEAVHVKNVELEASLASLRSTHEATATELQRAKTKIETTEAMGSPLVRSELKSGNRSSYFNRPTPSAVGQDYEFVHSTIPLSSSIHAPRNPPQSSRRPPLSSSSDAGTVRSLGGGGAGAGAELKRTPSPCPSRASVISRVTMDDDGWWSAD